MGTAIAAAVTAAVAAPALCMAAKSYHIPWLHLQTLRCICLQVLIACVEHMEDQLLKCLASSINLQFMLAASSATAAAGRCCQL